ncbi:hypothetical protein HELRODRAFT_102838 [Helobdella robusta]|uniref:Protein inhibitor of activated STAT n=1 Tax=Helobdella robusta TaxID=6412 RepID=T1EDC2_HELRO|nr:hypothetical protein HELRODRAFT_102838 [Helobdella robusta]ESN95023.1 hypothetical protein HELRODRAFT_102838 [Helobdella robusta]
MKKMTEKTDLRNMVMSFRVSELQLLLGIANQSRCGRKTELMQRALMLVEGGVSLQVQAKIKELHQKYSQRISVGYASYLMNRNQAESDICPILNDRDCVAPQENLPPFVEVRLKHLPFYDILCDVMKPVSLIPKLLQNKQQENRVSFSLNENHIREISNSRQSLGNNQFEFSCQLQLRFCLNDPSSRQPDCFPNGVAVKVNGVFAPLPNLIPTNKPGVEAKRPNRPVDITRLCRLSTSINNVVTIIWSIEENKSHCACINLVRKLNSSTLLQRLKRNGVCKSETTKALIKEKLSMDQDAEIAMTSLRVSLLCPLGKMRMTLPCRATSCSHLQCFDALTYLQMNEKKPTWVCPVCDRSAEFNKLIIDGLFVEVLKEMSDSVEVELMKDGSWTLVSSEYNNSNNNNNNNSSSKNNINLDDSNLLNTSLEMVNDSTNISTPVPSTEPQHNHPNSAAGADEDIIDLTETDDESTSCDLVTTTTTSSSSTSISHDNNNNNCKSNSKPHRQRNFRVEASDNPSSTSYSNDDSPTIYDLSPVNIPLRNNSPPLTPASPSPVLVPPLAHRHHSNNNHHGSSNSQNSSGGGGSINFNPFKHTSNFSSSSSSTSTSPFNLPAYPSTSSSIFPALGFDSLLHTDPAVLELFSLMANPLANFSPNRGALGQHRTDNLFDFLYDNSVRTTTSSDGVLTYNNGGISSPKGRRS